MQFAQGGPDEAPRAPQESQLVHSWAGHYLHTADEKTVVEEKVGLGTNTRVAIAWFHHFPSHSKGLDKGHLQNTEGGHG